MITVVKRTILRKKNDKRLVVVLLIPTTADTKEYYSRPHNQFTSTNYYNAENADNMQRGNVVTKPIEAQPGKLIKA